MVVSMTHTGLHPSPRWSFALLSRNDDGTNLIQSGRSRDSPIHRLGLFGDGEVIGIGDDWLDVNQRFFVATPTVEVCSDVSFSWPELLSSTANVTFPVPGCLSSAVNADHRKIAGYWTVSSDTVPKDGAHGTHVAGTAAGGAFKPTTVSAFNGAAPKAKVVFTQLGLEDGIFPVLLDYNFTSVYFGWSYAMGARIHSNSWGASEVTEDEYGCDSWYIDRFVAQQRDMLVLFAAGNDGDTESRSFLSTESQTKNTLVVGSSQTTNEHFVQEFAPFQAISNKNGLRGAIPPVCTAQTISTVLGCINSALTSAGYAPFNNLNTMTGWVCGRYFSGNSTCMSPSLLLYCPLSTLFAAAMSSICPDDLSESYLQHGAAQFNEHTVSFFSSYGPTADGRIKPEVVAPGDSLLSAQSHADKEMDYDCSSESSDLVAMAGTSMATPLVAGSAALVRQYYVQGYHVDGVMNVSVGIAPSAALMKATLIVSAVHALAWSKCIPSKPFPCFDEDVTWFNSTTATTRADHEGYGIVQLDQVLNLAGNSTTPGTDVILFAYYACSPSRVLAQGESRSYLFSATNTSRPFKATLVWTDPPNTPMAASQLVNNLDLSVAEQSTGQSYWGNGYIYGVNQPDHINNVETVWIDQPAGGLYNVTVTAHSINEGPSQDYALVVTFTDGTASTPSTTSSCTFNALTLADLNRLIAGDPEDFFAPSSTATVDKAAATTFSEEVVV